jgi:ubiquinone/menaquinone biosynthesis C-methylase UbiE
MTDEPTRRIATAFDVLAPTYEVLQFVRQAAERLVEVADLQPGMRVLDVATGTGHAARAAAARVGPNGSVLGIDISEGMLEIARGALDPLGLPIEVRVGDVQALDLPDASFDAVICASGIFFVPDMDAAARECRRVLVPGGQLAFTSFGASMLEDLRVRFGAVLARHGYPPKPPPPMPLQEPEASRALLERAGFVDVEAWTEQLGYHLPDGEARWREIEASLEARALAGVPADVGAQVREEPVAERDALAGQDGLWVDVATNFATGRAP